MTRFGLAALAGVALFGVQAQAATLTHYTSAWFFGDSLTDPGNLYAATGGQVPPSPPYFEGQRSNGPVWAVHVAEAFEAKGLDTGNFAFSGAHALPSDGDAFPVPDLPQQVAAFASLAGKELGDRPAAFLWFGANDVIGAIEDAPTPQNVAETAVAAALAVVDGIDTLQEMGLSDVFVLNLPALEKTPAFTAAPAGAAALAGLGSTLFNAALTALLDASGDAGATLIDMNAYFDDLIANPLKYGVANATIPCIIPGVRICGPEEADLLAFYDPLHPNRVVHGQIASIIGASVAPVPLPAPVLLLGAALAGLVLVRRRGRGVA